MVFGGRNHPEIKGLLPLNSKGIGSPKNDHVKTVGLNKFADTQVQIIEIEPEHIIKRIKPKTIDKQVHWQFRIAYEKISPATYVAVIPNGRFWGENNVVITDDDRVLVGGYSEFGIQDTNNLAFSDSRIPEPKETEETLAVLSGFDGYYHWMFDILPRLELLERAGVKVDRYIINKSLPDYQIETLDILGIPLDMTIVSQDLYIKAKNLIYPSLPGEICSMPYASCSFLRNSFLPHKDFDTKQCERIYITREMAGGRRVKNESQVIQLLQSLGFKKLVLESISIREKAALFSKAKVVIGPHGAGFTNLVFCNPGTTVIEFFSPNYVNVCYWALSNQLDLEYYYLIASGPQLPDFVNPHLYTEDILIDIEKLEDILDLAGVK